MEAYRLALAKGENSAFLHTQLAMLYLKKGQADKALQESEEAIRANPRHLPAYVLLGGLYLSRNQREEAIHVYQRAIEIDPQNQEAHLFLGTLFARRRITSRRFPISKP